MLLAQAACGPPSQSVVTQFIVSQSGIESSTGQLQFFVSDVRMVDANGSPTPVRLDPAPHQDHRTALIAIPFDGRETPRANRTLLGTVRRGDYVSMEFLVGVPYDRNHRNPLHAGPPLDRPAMFWSWQAGMKFLRLDLDNAWSFHLGSTGCHSASAVRAPAAECRRPNLARIRLPAGAASDGTVAIDLAALLGDVHPGRDPNCMGDFAKHAVCRDALGALGLDADTGRCVAGCTAQRVFRPSGS